MATFAIKSGGHIALRCLPSRGVAERIRVREYPEGKVIIDPRSVRDR